MNEMERQRVDYELYTPSDEENKVLHSLDKTYSNVCLMTNEEQEFLNSIILRNRPVKLLEVGVHEGGSSVIMLNAIKIMQMQNYFPSIIWRNACLI